MLLEQLTLSGVGPCESLEMDCAPRLNVLTGDNGLGKSFLLDVIWWLFTRTWAGEEITPSPAADKPTVSYQFEGKAARAVCYVAQRREWSFGKGRPNTSGLVIYARVDGSFSVWDSARYNDEDGDTRTAAYHFAPDEVWSGLSAALEGKETRVCNGLIHDWVLWQTEGSAEFQQLKRFLEVMSPSTQERLTPGAPMRQTKAGVLISQRLPTLLTPYGETVPLTHASAAVRRVIALAYLIVWSWQEHTTLSRLIQRSTTPHITLLVDEVETHLHPQWQRRIIPSLLSAITHHLDAGKLTAQAFITTHAPLILASLEPHFTEQDKLWTFDLVREEDGARVVFSQVPWTRRGDANSWLTSEVFDLKQARSLEAEQALEAARRLLVERAPSEEALEEVTRALARSLSPIDSFWLRWSTYLEGRGITL